MSFASLANSITTYLQTVADANNFTVRYDNDLRTTPTPASGFWLQCKIEFGDSQQKELGINSYRNFGKLVITLKNKIGIGIGTLLANADIIVTAFKSVDIDAIIFKVPSVKNKGRVDDNWVLEVSCPFHLDE